MLASPPARGSVRHARFSERLSRQLSPQQYMSGLLLDPATIEKHNMANGFGSGLATGNGLSSRDSSPPPPHSTRKQSQVLLSSYYFLLLLSHIMSTRIITTPTATWCFW